MAGGVTEAVSPRRRSGAAALLVVILTGLVVVALGAAGGLVLAIRAGLVGGEFLPPDLLALVHTGVPAAAPEEGDREAPPLRLWAPDLADPDLSTALLAVEGTPEFRFVETPRLEPDALCAVMNMTGLRDARWDEDPVIAGEWTCFTDVREFGGDVEEDPSTVFGLLRGRNRGAADIMRVTVIENAPDSGEDARRAARQVMDAVLKQSGLAAPAGFLEALAAGEPFAVMRNGLRFTVRANPPRTDAIVVAEGSAGLLPTDWFSGKGPRLPGDPVMEAAPPLPDEEIAAPEEPIPGFGAPLGIGEDEAPGFEMAPDLLPTLPAEEPAPETAAGEAPPSAPAEPADAGEAPPSAPAEPTDVREE